MSDQDDNLTPSPRTVSPQGQSFPDSLGKTIGVPQDQVNAGDNNAIPRDVDSPESLDEALTQGDDRDKIDPHHSVDYNLSGDDDTDFAEDN
jgi:hypothetical protein